MGLGSLVAQAVEAARAAAESLGMLGEVRHEAWTGQGATGDAGYDGPIPRLALIAEGEQQHATKDGRAVVTRATLTFFPPEPGQTPPEIGPRDRLTLPSGLTGPIVEIAPATVDPDTGAVLMRVVWLA